MNEKDNNTFDFKDFMIFFKSSRNIIATREIFALYDSLFEQVELSSCGAIIYGMPRIGKTRAMMYTAKKLKAEYGDNLPIYIWNCKRHEGNSDTDKYFYNEMLYSMSAPAAKPRDSAQSIRQRVLNTMEYEAMHSYARIIILFIDEAQWVTEKDYGWLIGLYNDLNLEDIQLVVFLFGQPELKAQKNDYARRGQRQIVGRFMIDEFEFKGIRNSATMLFFLDSLDRTMEYPSQNEGEEYFNLTRTLFPRAYADQKYITMLAEPLWEAFQEVRRTFGIKAEDIPMRYVIDALAYCFLKYSAYSKGGEVFPCKEDLVQCVKKTGYFWGEQIDTSFEKRNKELFTK